MTERAAEFAPLLTEVQAKETAELRLLARPDLGDCVHDPSSGFRPEDCLRCQARRELKKRDFA